jgi:hypothetical protein
MGRITKKVKDGPRQQDSAARGSDPARKPV